MRYAKSFDRELATMMRRAGLVFVFIAASVSAGFAQKAGPKTDTSVIDADGTAHITRVVPVPETLSPEAQKMVGQVVSDKAKPQTLAEQRSGTDAWQARAGGGAQTTVPVR